MTIKEFEILRFLCENRGVLTQRLISEQVHYSLGTVNTIISSFQQADLIDDEYHVNEKGYALLEPYRVNNAIILAAGMSTRFTPVSYELPKGLISVKGEVLVEREINQLLDAGIQEIIVVIGYMMEKFLYLRDKYNVKLVVNNEYATKNTHSSVYVARDFLKNTYILCSDNYYPNNMFHQYEYRSYYCSVFLPGVSYVERAFTYNRDGLIIDTNKPSHDQWIMYGHAFFDNSFSTKFRPLLEEYFGRPGIEGMYWENVWAENVADYPMWIKKCSDSEILEFDSMEELSRFDPDFIFNNKIHVFENICNVLKCSIGDISDINIIKKGLNNQSFSFVVNGQKYIYRHPGVNASGVIDRRKEAKSLRTAKSLGIDDTLVYIDEDEGWKISRFINTTDTFDFSKKQHIDLLAKKLKILHDSRISVGFRFDYQKETDRIIEILKHSDALAYRRSLYEREQMSFIFDYLSSDPWQISLCHNDIYEPNILLDGSQLHLIDWEFSGDSDIGFDICKLFCVNNTPYDEIDYWVEQYYGRALTKHEKLHLVACAAVIYFYWFIWGIYGGKNNQDVSSYMMAWYDKMNGYREMVRSHLKD